MKAFSKILTGGVAAAALAVTAASPAQAQSWDRYRDRDRGIDAGDIITGVAVVGGIAALIAALDNGNDRYRYDRGYGYGNGYDRYGYGSPQAAVNACGRQAQRYGRNIRITDLDRTDGYYRVRGRIDTVDYDYGRWNRGYDVDRERFTCYARGNRVYDFRV
ncbi:hypothetical protein [Sphingosinicella terrae]|uniref:hypothetical protein n=1 Tax=Sphingosinicella terrae TaxID=2172047 RepID=UPI000E0D7212|nr:hypothetical protein [Sphingosinicella terrae]